MTWEYIAGFFDGEGSITHNGKGWRISIAQTNKEVLDRIKVFTKIGGVFEVVKRQSHWKDSWVYFIAKQGDVYKFLKNINNLVIVKKEKSNKVLPELEEYLKKYKLTIKKRNQIKIEARRLRNLGRTYRQIGKELKIDFGQARRIILNVK
jgi:intein/homing endonuclease